MDLEITPVLQLFDEEMNYLDNNTGTGGGVVDVGITDISSFEDKWEVQLSEVAARIDGVSVFSRGM